MKQSIIFNLAFPFIFCLSIGFIFTINGQVIASLKPTKVQNIQNFHIWRFTGIDFARSPVSYPYDFVNPVASSTLCDQVSQTGTPCNRTAEDKPDGRYFIAGMGPRMTVSGSNITRDFDFHLGADIINRTQSATTANLPEIKCMCAGTVEEIDNTDDSDHGLSVKVKCNDTFEGMGTAGWGNIYMNYRHLSSINSSLNEGQTISKGDTIGIMGNTGTHSGNNHLHLSLQRKVRSKYYNAHPLRAFNPAKNPHLLQTLDNSEMEIHFLNINTWRTDRFIVIRIAVPHYQAGLEMISLRAGPNTRTFDMEQRSHFCHDDTTCLDDNNFDNLELFVFPFTRLDSAFDLYEETKESLEASHSGKSYPIKNEGVFQKSAYVIDIKTPVGRMFTVGSNGIEIFVSDIWGQGVRAEIPPSGI